MPADQPCAPFMLGTFAPVVWLEVEYAKNKKRPAVRSHLEPVSSARASPSAGDDKGPPPSCAFTAYSMDAFTTSGEDLRVRPPDVTEDGI